MGPSKKPKDLPPAANVVVEEDFGANNLIFNIHLNSVSYTLLALVVSIVFVCVGYWCLKACLKSFCCPYDTCGAWFRSGCCCCKKTNDGQDEVCKNLDSRWLDDMYITVSENPKRR